MTFSQLYATGSAVISVEICPPKNDQEYAELERDLPALAGLAAPLFHVAYAARPSSRRFALELADKLRHVYGKDVASHVTCVAATASDIDALLDELTRIGVQNVVALRGKPPRGHSQFLAPPGGYLHAEQLVAHIRRRGGFSIGVAGHVEKHPESADAASDLDHLKDKIRAGADVIFTQFFYDNRVFYRFVEQCRAHGIDLPIVPSLLPILDAAQGLALAEAFGVSLPPALRMSLQTAHDDPTRTRRIGIEHTILQARDLLSHGVCGIHFHSLNQPEPMMQILSRLTPAA
ncbi:methylenetetrahydrofolate reductase [Fontivita pretiosa]|uniref:methylenetetrahydrofolate reductase n=1 Tax=Fontivita pretiosa TaxID=2989684 RepID=UPI003D1823C5